MARIEKTKKVQAKKQKPVQEQPAEAVKVSVETREVGGFTLIKGLEVPEVTRSINRVYPFEHMEIGDCFRLPVDFDANKYAPEEVSKARTEAKTRVAAKLSSAARSYRRSHPDFDYQLTTQKPDGVYLWRVPVKQKIAKTKAE